MIIQRERVGQREENLPAVYVVVELVQESPSSLEGGRVGDPECSVVPCAFFLRTNWLAESTRASTLDEKSTSSGIIAEPYDAR